MKLRALSILAIGTLAGCGGAADGQFAAQPVAGKAADPLGPPAAGNVPAYPAREAAAQSDPVPPVDDSLARLRALNVIRVENVVVELPREAYNCYGLCKDAYEAARAAVAPRLSAFVNAAEVAANTGAECTDCSKQVDENLAELRGLSLLSAVDIIVEQANNNPNCYSLPCPEDIAAAAAVNAERAAKLDAIVKASRGL